MANGILLLVLTCLFGLSNSNQNTQNLPERQVACWECTIEKSMDNRVLGLVDEVYHRRFPVTTCEKWFCRPGQDWCLVTHYKMRAADGNPESKRERHECGNRNYRDSNTRCKMLLMEDKEHNKIIESSCHTKRTN